MPSTTHSTRFWDLNRGTTWEPLFFDGEEVNTKADKNAKGTEVQEEEDTKADENTAEEVEEQEEEDLKADEDEAEEAEVQEGGDSQDAEAVGQKLHDKSRMLKDYTAYQIEEGLTRGIPTISELVASKFPKIPRLSNGVLSKKDGSRILLACQKLQFETVVDALKTFFRARDEKHDPIPLSCDVDDPSDLRRILR